jgi:plastocyanin
MSRAVLVLVVLVGLVAAQLASGGSSQAQSFTVIVGEQTKPPAGTAKQVALNQFFPGRLTIAAGDKVTFSSFGFHTVTYLAGQPFPAFLGPAKGKVYQGPSDAAGQPFFFDGEQKFEYNAPLFGPYGPKVIAGKPANAGILVAQNPKKAATATYTFPKAGRYKLVCVVHPQMGTLVVVKPKGATVPSPDDVAAQAKAETDAAWAKAEAFTTIKPPKNTIYMGVEGPRASGGRTTLLDFVPDIATAKAGTRVTFVVKTPTEAHNATFGPVKYINKLSKQTDLLPFGPPNAPNQVTPFFIYGSDPPATAYDGSSMHGNGFFSIPVADDFPGPPPKAFSVTFAKPGKYHFICIIHGPDMAADIRVTK